MQRTYSEDNLGYDEQAVRLFIIIFIDVYHKSEYIPTVTNFASILANCFFSAEDNSSTAFRTKFLRSARQVLPKTF